MSYNVIAEARHIQLLQHQDGHPWRVVEVDRDGDRVYSVGEDDPPARTGARKYTARWTDRGIEYVSQPLTEAQARRRFEGLTTTPAKTDWCQCDEPITKPTLPHFCNRCWKEIEGVTADA